MFQKLFASRSTPFQRSSRFFHVMSSDENIAGWYFHTREGIDHGPYLTMEEAQDRCASFIKKCIESSQAGGRLQIAPA